MPGTEKRSFAVLGGLLRAARDNAGMTRADVLARVGVNVTTLQRYEDGYRQAPVTVLAQLAPIYGVSVEYFTTQTGITTGKARLDTSDEIMFIAGQIVALGRQLALAAERTRATGAAAKAVPSISSKRTDPEPPHKHERKPKVFNPRAFGSLVRARREELHLSRAQLAKGTKMSGVEAWDQLERGIIQDDGRVELVRRVLKALKASAVDLGVPESFLNPSIGD